MPRPPRVIFNRGSELCSPAHFRFSPKADVAEARRVRAYFKLRFEITDAARLLANSGLERFLGCGCLGAGLGKIVAKAHNLAFGGFATAS
jgi:hypothetical protein